MSRQIGTCTSDYRRSSNSKTNKTNFYYNHKKIEQKINKLKTLEMSYQNVGNCSQNNHNELLCYSGIRPIKKENVVKNNLKSVTIRIKDGREYIISKSLFYNYKLPDFFLRKHKIDDFWILNQEKLF